MSDAKRTPYREAGAPSARKVRGTLVSRAEEPEADEPAHTIATQREPVDPDAGIFSGLVSPHPASTANEWGTQALLTLVALPLLATTFVLVGWLDMRRVYGAVERGHAAPRPWGIAHPVAWIFGAIPLAIVMYAREWPWPVALILIAVPFAALFARRIVRQGVIDRTEVLDRMRRRKR